MRQEVIALKCTEKGLRNKDFLTNWSWVPVSHWNGRTAHVESGSSSLSSLHLTHPYPPHSKENMNSDLQDNSENDQWVRKLAPKEKWKSWNQLFEQRQDYAAMELDTSNRSLTKKCSVLQKGNQCVCVYIYIYIYVSFLCMRNDTGLTSPSLSCPQIRLQTINCSFLHVGMEMEFPPSMSCSKIQQSLNTAMKKLSCAAAPSPARLLWKAVAPAWHFDCRQAELWSWIHSWNCLGSSLGGQTRSELSQHPARGLLFLGSSLGLSFTAPFRHQLHVGKKPLARLA